ncbi:MFS transporter [bacterium]|nr:MFS transporter [bacterium]
MNASPKTTQKIRITRNVIALGVVSLFTDAATEMIYPLVPVFVTLLGSSVFILGVIEGVAETTAALLKLASGMISDRIGKRKILIVIGYGISTFIRPLTGAVSAAWQIVFVRMTDRIGKGIRTAPRDALIASSIDESIRGRAYGFHRAMDHAGAVIGPLLAVSALIVLVLVFRVRETVSILRWTFYVSIIPGLLALSALLIFVQEKPSRAPESKQVRFSFGQFDRNFLMYVGVVTLFTLGNSSDAFLLFRIQQMLHNSPSVYESVISMPVVGKAITGFGNPDMQKRLIELLFIPLIWAFFHIIKVIFSTPLGALSDTKGRKSVIRTGWGVYAAVYFAFAVLDRFPESWQVPVTFVLFAVYALYYAFCEGAEKAFVADLVGSGQRGSAFGLFSFATGAAALPASVVFGLLYQAFGAAAAFGTGAFLALVAMLLLNGIREKKYRGMKFR